MTDGAILVLSLKLFILSFVQERFAEPFPPVTYSARSSVNKAQSLRLSSFVEWPTGKRQLQLWKKMFPSTVTEGYVG